MTQWVALLTAISATSLVYFLLSSFLGVANFEDNRVQTRLDRLLSRRPATSRIAKNMQFSSIEMLNELFKKQQMYQRVYEMLLLSGWTMPPNLFIFLDLMWAMVVFLFARWISHSALTASLMGAATAAIPYLLLIVNKRRYVNRFTVYFPDSLLMMKNAVRAGQGIHSAFEIVAKEGPKPISTEFSRMLQEVELGSHLNEALNSVYRRVPTIDLRIFVLGIFIQQEVGGNLTELFEHIEKTIRDRISLVREIKAITAQGRLSGVVLMILPLTLVVIIRILSPNYFDPLFHSELGHKIITVFVILQLIGMLVIHRLTTVSMID